MLASTTTTIAAIGVVVILVGFVVYGLFNVWSGRREVGSEQYLAPNRKPYYTDEELEGPRLERMQLFGVLLLIVVTVALPLYWILEPGRQAGAQEGWDKRLASWGEQLFATTEDGGFNCAGCHGANGVGGVAPFTVTDGRTGEVQAVSWASPAVNTIFYRFDEEEVRFILNYGRPFSPMSPWGLVGGGPMNAQQIDTLIEYMKSIQIPREGCLPSELEGDEYFAEQLCASGTLPADIQQDIQNAAERAVDNGEAATLGEALFNLELASGAYSCARCHTPGWSWGDPGQSGQGAFGWNLRGGAVNNHFDTEEDLIAFLKAGSVNGQTFGNQGQGSGRMPGFGAMLTDDQIQAIVEYVRSL